MYQDSLQVSSSSNPIASTADIGNTKCLLTSSTKWVIDFGTTIHMTGNSSLFFTPLSPAFFPFVTLTDGSKSSILGSDTVNLTSSLCKDTTDVSLYILIYLNNYNIKTFNKPQYKIQNTIKVPDHSRSSTYVKGNATNIKDNHNIINQNQD